MISFTAQTWFDNALQRSKIPIKSYSDVYASCVYSATEEAPGCFVGISLTFEQAQAFDLIVEEGENASAVELVEKRKLGVSDLKEILYQEQFLGQLQHIHDFNEPSKWPELLEAFKNSWNLK